MSSSASTRRRSSPGRHWIGPGGTSAPVAGPDGRGYVLYHAETAPNPGHVSAARFLMVSPIVWNGLGGCDPSTADGKAS